MKTRYCILLASLLFGSVVQAQINYQTIPLPRQIEMDASGKTFALIRGQEVSYPEGNDKMKRNAQFAQEYFALEPTVAPRKNTAPVQLTLGLKNTNPDAYAITVSGKGIIIQGASESGVFYGLQTLRKSLPAAQTDTVALPYVVIKDEPRFGYRGTELDCARHFFSVEDVKLFIDALALHGVNRFHWHLTDDQGWRMEVKALPLLTEKASKRPHSIIGRNVGLREGKPIYDDVPEEGFYSQDDMREVVRYAAERYITIIPEIDLPGHMVAALSVYPHLGCTGGPYHVWCQWGISDDVLCAGNPQTLDFLRTVLGELCEIFPGKYIHIGGDESPRTKWEHCAKCQAKMKEMGFTKEAQLQTYITQEMEKFLESKGREIIGWDEILEGGLSDNATVMSWRGFNGGIQAARQHHKVIMTPTSHCYIDYLQLKDLSVQPQSIGGYLPLSKVYSLEPIPKELTPEEQPYIIGAQCNLWTEYIASIDHAFYMLLPRLAAMSEVQWMLPEQKDFEQFSTQRLPALKRLYDRLGYKYCATFE